MGKKNSAAQPTAPTKPMHGVKPKGHPFELTKRSYDTLTVLVPGTFAPLGPLPIWYVESPGGRSLHSYLKNNVYVGQDFYVHQHTTLAGYETLRDAIALTDHWSSTYPLIWKRPKNRLADLIRRP